MACSSSCLVFLLIVFLCLLLPIENAESAYSNTNGISSQKFDFFSNGLAPYAASLLVIEGDASVGNDSAQIPKSNQYGGQLVNKTGRVSFAQPVQLWNATTGKTVHFFTQFSFTVNGGNKSSIKRGLGHGLAFFIAPFSSKLPHDSEAGYLGLVSEAYAFNSSSSQPFVAVEFDTFPNPQWDPRTAHIGINVNSIDSKTNVAWKCSELVLDGSSANAEISYNATSTELSVYVVHPATGSTYSFGYLVDLKTVLPEKVRIGFAAATGGLVEINNIFNWVFNSTSEN